jgi:hypothetical protein
LLSQKKLKALEFVSSIVILITVETTNMDWSRLHAAFWQAEYSCKLPPNLLIKKRSKPVPEEIMVEPIMVEIDVLDPIVPEKEKATLPKWVLEEYNDPNHPHHLDDIQRKQVYVPSTEFVKRFNTLSDEEKEA